MAHYLRDVLEEAAQPKPRKTLVQLGTEFNRHSGASTTLPQSLQRAGEELMEAIEACDTDATADKGEVLEEMADVILTLASAAARHGLDLDSAVQAKHEVNMRRQWKPHPHIPGAVKHVKGT